jgi:DNA-directed RNA polymerase subunit N (RpoN/RPB10)
MEVTLSKTDYILCRECSKNAWFKIHKPAIFFNSGLSDFEKSIIETGNEVELVARKLFPDGVLVEGRDVKAQQQTLELIANKQRIIFQPIFVKNSFLAALDILEFDEKTNSYSVYEVKATNEIDDKVHYHDLAFQVNLLKKVGIEVNKSYVIHLNSEYVRFGELNEAELFKIEDVTVEVQSLCDTVMSEMTAALEYLSEDTEPKGPCICISKGRSKHCATFKHSNPNVPDYGIHDIARIGLSKTKLHDLVDRDIFSLEDIPEDMELSNIQQNQVDAHVLNKVLVDKEKISEELEGLVFPLYFLDYETYPCAIPRFNGFSPYQQIPFQYSLHILQSPDSKPEHYSFLHKSTDDPTKSLAQTLQKHIGPTGSVIVWNKKFEIKINKELGDRYDSALPFVESVNSRIYDLMDVFSKQYYVHKAFLGSTSIKYVLPVLVPNLSYGDLDIKEGGTAAKSWEDAVNNTSDPETAAKIFNDLEKYCCRDTIAMYVIWEYLYKLVK